MVVTGAFKACPKATLLLLLSAPTIPGQSPRERVASCTVATVQERMSAVNDACCTTGVTCGDGAPSMCTAACAEAFRPFAEDCGAVLAALGVTGMADFGALCLRTNGCPLGFLEDATDIRGICSGNGYCEAPGQRGSGGHDKLPWLEFAENTAIRDWFAVATGGQVSFAGSAQTARLGPVF